MTTSPAIRPGEVLSTVDPAELTADAGLVFIGRARTPWRDRTDTPKSIRRARERGGAVEIEIDPPWRPGLKDLTAGSMIILLTWFDRSRRDLVIQTPRHSEGETGVFSLRSPVRPNPIGLHVVRVVACDADAGRLTPDALDCFDGTPVLDIKPWLPSLDVPP